MKSTASNRRLNVVRTARFFGASLLCGALAIVGQAQAADTHAAKDEHAAHGAKDAANEHGGHDEHGGGEINWIYGFAGEKADIDAPSVVWRKPGTPAPLGAYIINSVILFAVLYRFGKGPLLSSLQQRRQQIMQGIDDASRMKTAAAEQLAGYEAKLAKIDSEIERIKADMAASAAQERQRVLADTKARCIRLETEAKQLIVQEMKAAKEQLHIEVVQAAMRGAERLLGEVVTSADHERLSEEYLSSLGNAISGSSLVTGTKPGSLPPRSINPGPNSGSNS